ncbi:HpcH/HpaI aldolase/citrate lyase family protein [Nocardia sp. CDC159]|uniref:HpcH/HpaI aldolase/citrate lyase family protein n=1 Tax=Nocardia pulmonis TaxID=2951408 RepID=A0A9X2E776_9NOCA|nr:MULTISPECIES: aldolase/citrate lyase family protein [Nocardia]MCM6774120.1 HpcH/HpaI aldolase/citrate lyase family protein [Nocardia pulmonis]MCM6787007.1 HpcH/HpaI aldolase/citrate lyase family protein [Nocardia sp. CDC159]
MTLPPEFLSGLATRLGEIDAELARHYPGDRPGQPIHTAYVCAADATKELPDQWGASAGELAERHTALLTELAGADVLARVRNTLAHGPIQDLRLDFEDGYGSRGDEVEDRDAGRAGQILAALPAAVRSRGIRIKGLTGAEWQRAVRTLERVLDGAGGVPDGFVFTVPKLRSVEQVGIAVRLCEEMELAHGLPSDALRFELQIESPQAVIAADGSATVARAIHRSAGRCSGLHYGTYDYSAACGISPQFQSLEHPIADHAKAVMQAAAAQTGVWVCDGSTQVMPVGGEGEVAAAVARHFRLVTRSLERGYYQGWDMHPGHLVTRWAATFAFFRGALGAAAPRIDRYLRRQGGAVVDEPATAQALATVVLRGLDCGAFGPEDVTALAPAATVEVLTQLRERKLPTR